MTRMSTAVPLTMLLVLGCTSDPMGFRSSYRDRVVPPSANNRPMYNQPLYSQPVSNPPIASQPIGQPGAIGQTAILPQAALSDLAVAQSARNGQTGAFPMLASAGGQFDGRSFPLLNRSVQAPGIGGAKAIKRYPRSTALAGGLSGSPHEDLVYRGGWTIKDLKYINIYVGGKSAWTATDWKSIDNALAAAMSDEKLNNVVMQYFGNQPVTNQFLKSFFMEGWKPTAVAKDDLEAQVQSLYNQHAFDGLDLRNTVVNFMLPRGTVLKDPSGGAQQKVSNAAIPLADAEDSTGGLGGYHGSAHIGNATVYYSVGVYSERMPNGGTNGIPVFNANWKNVVATFYHELQEARTDADVDDAATSPLGMRVLGWTSDTGNEIGDYPIAEAKSLLQVFQEVPLADGSGTVPVQLCYSNAVHGPEGPIDYPHGLEPGPGRPPTNNPRPNNPVPSDPGPSNPASPISNLPQEIRGLISNWDTMEDYVKKAILKLLT